MKTIEFIDGGREFLFHASLFQFLKSPIDGATLPQTVRLLETTYKKESEFNQLLTVILLSC